jgi:hypothetical protein
MHKGEVTVNAQTLLHRLLYRAFLDIRIALVTGEAFPMFEVVDFYHNLPLAMDEAASGHRSYESVLSDLRERANHKRCRQWFEGLVMILQDEERASERTDGVE